MKVIEKYTSAWQTINGHQMPNINIWWRIINQIWNHVKQHLPQTKCCLVNSRRCACLASFKNLKTLFNNSLLEIFKIKIFKIPFCSEEYSTEEYPARCQLHSTVNWRFRGRLWRSPNPHKIWNKFVRRGPKKNWSNLRPRELFWFEIFGTICWVRTRWEGLATQLVDKTTFHKWLVADGFPQ